MKVKSQLEGAVTVAPESKSDTFTEIATLVADANMLGRTAVVVVHSWPPLADIEGGTEE